MSQPYLSFAAGKFVELEDRGLCHSQICSISIMMHYDIEEQLEIA